MSLANASLHENTALTESGAWELATRYLALMVIGLAGLVLTGWLTGAPLFYRMHAGWPACTPTTAFGFLLSGMALWGFRSGQRSKHPPRMAWTATTILLVGGILLGMFPAWSESEAIGHWFFSAGDNGGPTAVSPATAAGFVWMGVGLVTLHRRFPVRLSWLPMVCAIVVFVTGLIGTGNLLASPDAGEDVMGFESMALPTALGFLLCGGGLLGLRGPGLFAGWLGVDARSPGSRWRFFVPVAISLPIAFTLVVVVSSQFPVLSIPWLVVVLAVTYCVGVGWVMWRALSQLLRAAERQQESDLQLARSEQRLRQIIESLPQPVWACDVAGSCDYLSPRWTDYTGRPLASELGHGWVDSLHPDDRERATRTWAEGVATGKPLVMEYRLRRHDGIYRWFQARAAPARDEAGHIIKWFGSSTDVDDFKVSEAVIEDSRLKLEELVKQRTLEIEKSQRALEDAQSVAKLGSWTLDVATGAVEWSDELFRIYGLPIDQPVPSYEEHRALFADESWERLTTAVETAVQTGRGYLLELRYFDKANREHWGEARAHAHTDVTGKVTHLSGTFQDITATKELRADLLDKTFRLQLALSVGRIGVWSCDLTERVVSWDETVRNFYGSEEPGVTVDQWLGYIDPADRKVVAGKIKRATGDSHEVDCQFSITSATGGAITRVRLRAEVLRSPDGRAINLVGLNQDVTEEWQSQKRLVEQRKELRQSNTDLQQFAYVASHDLQEPLRAISGCVQLLQKRYAPQIDDSGRELMDHAVSGARRMQTLIEELLAYAQVGSRSFNIVSSSLQMSFEQARQNLTSLIAETDTRIEVVSDWPEMKIDVDRMTQVLQNLLSNAIKYRHPDRPPRIALTIEEQEESWGIAITDNGIGISPEFHQRIFDLFQRLHTREKYDGVGIGLAICLRVVERHGGSISVFSDGRTGSRFTLLLPR